MHKSMELTKFLTVSILSLTFCVSGASETQSAQKILEDMTLTYSQVNYMKNSFERVETSQLLGTKKKTKGNIEYSKKKIRVEFKKGSKDLFIRGEKYFWHVGEDGDVLMGSVERAVPNVFVSIFTDPGVWKGLGTKHLNVPEKNIAHLEVDPKGQFPSIEKMKLKINTKKRTLLEVSYTDDIGNQTDIKFNNNRFFPKSKPNRFQYQIKKTDKVTKI